MPPKRLTKRLLITLTLLMTGELCMILGLTLPVIDAFIRPSTLFVETEQELNGSVNQTNPIYTVENIMAGYQIEGFQTNGTPVIIHINGSLGTVLHLTNQTSLENITLILNGRTNEFYTVQVIRQTNDATFQFRLVVSALVLISRIAPWWYNLLFIIGLTLFGFGLHQLWRFNQELQLHQ